VASYGWPSSLDQRSLTRQPLPSWEELVILTGSGTKHPRMGMAPDPEQCHAIDGVWEREEQPMIPLAEQIAEAQRELALRRKCYPAWVRSGKLDAGDATYQGSRHTV
jgi:hypothetical protein